MYPGKKKSPTRGHMVDMLNLVVR